MKDAQTSHYFSHISLENLLEQFRLRGIAISTLELQRLQAVFASQPDLSRTQLRDLLCSLLAKDAQQRRTITHVFEQLIPYTTDHTVTKRPISSRQLTLNPSSANPSSAEEESLDEAEEQDQEPTQKRLTAWHIGLGIVVLLLITGLIALKLFDAEQQEKIGKITLPPPPKIAPQTATEVTKKEHQHTLKLAEYVTLWTPEIVAVEAYPVWQRSLPAILLLIGSGLGFVWLLQQALQRTRTRKPMPLRIRKQGKLWLPSLQKQPDYHLLSSEQRREMSWGIGRYLSEQPLTQLDIPRSVNASAKSGLPQLYFRAAQREREVWLWQDRSSDNADLSRLAAEIKRTLRAVNIDCQQGYFHALPDKISNQYGELIWSNQHEYPENQPLVVILADGDSLGRMASVHSGHGYRSLRQLSHWQHLCFVDCSIQAGALCQLLKALPLECLSPQQVATWLAQQGHVIGKKSSLSCPLGDLHRWAIACALPSRPLMEAEIRALHDALALDCAWQYHQLQRYAHASTQGFDFTQSRHSLLQEFAQLALVNEHETRADGYTDFVPRTLHFWQQRYQEMDNVLAKQETPRFPWQDSRRQQQLQLDLALCELWQRDSLEQAANTLFDLHQHQGRYSLKREVERRLGHYTCLDWQEAEARQERIVLPYQWHSIDAKIQQQLKAAGFGGQAQQFDIGWNKTTGVLLGALAGLVIMAMVISVKNLMPLFAPEDAKVKTVPYSPEPRHYLQESKDGQLVVGQAKTGVFEQVQAPDNATVHVMWHKQTAQQAQMPLTKNDSVELWRLGENKHVKRPSEDWFDISIAIIQASPQSAKAQTLAAKLLDSGTADQVLIGRSEHEWKQARADLLASLGQSLTVQVLYINTAQQAANKGDNIAWWGRGSISHLLRSLDKSQRYTVAELGGKVLAGQPALIGFRQVIELQHGMKLLPVPQGSFQMGSNTDDDNERPVHTVIFNYDFWMSETEVTFAQYDAYATAAGKNKPSDSEWGRDTRPVINVSWEDAQGYANWLSKQIGQSCRLPSEAEWEYAARSGSTTNYFFGKNNAVCDGCGSQWDNKQTAPVGSFAANAWGLKDMNGNVWEWVQDGYQANYEGAPIDGSAWKKVANRRVLRGGSWINNKHLLRPSARDFNTPNNRSSYVGFRVVCVPHLLSAE